jgi:hypothetical protein
MNRIHKRESGQAMIELAVMLLLLTFATIGMLLVCGLSDFSGDALLESRFNAELKARTGNSDVSGTEYTTWKSEDNDFLDNKLNIPFAIGERPTRGASDIGPFGENLNDAVHSVPDETRPYSNYRKLNTYHKLNDFDSAMFSNDFYENASNQTMLEAANLSLGTPDDQTGNPLGNILSRSGHRKAANRNPKANEAYNSLLRGIANLFGVDLEDAGYKISNAPGNKSYIPATTKATE